MKQRGSVGVVCLAIVAGLLLLAQSVYRLIEADYRYVRTYIRQQQCALASSSGLNVVERLGENKTENFALQFQENLPPTDKLIVDLNIYQDGSVRWLSSCAGSGDIQVRMVRGQVSLPDGNHVAHSHGIVSRVFRIDPQADVVAGSFLDYTSVGNGRFFNYRLTDYARYGFLLDTNTVNSGWGRSIFYDGSGARLVLPSGRRLDGRAVFANQGEIVIGTRSKYPDPVHFIGGGNIIVGAGAELSCGLLLAEGAVKISTGSKVRGRIYAKQGVVIEAGAQVRPATAEELQVVTDAYLW